MDRLLDRYRGWRTRHFDGRDHDFADTIAGLVFWFAVFLLAVIILTAALGPSHKDATDRIWSGVTALGTLLVAVVAGMMGSRATLRGIEAQSERADRQDVRRTNLADSDRRIADLNRVIAAMERYDALGRTLIGHRGLTRHEAHEAPPGYPQERAFIALEGYKGALLEMNKEGGPIIEAAEAYGRPVSGQPFLSDTIRIWVAMAHQGYIRAADADTESTIEEIRPYMFQVRSHIRGLRLFEEAKRDAYLHDQPTPHFEEYKIKVDEVAMKESLNRFLMIRENFLRSLSEGSTKSSQNQALNI